MYMILFTSLMMIFTSVQSLQAMEEGSTDKIFYFPSNIELIMFCPEIDEKNLFKLKSLLENSPEITDINLCGLAWHETHNRQKSVPLTDILKIISDEKKDTLEKLTIIHGSINDSSGIENILNEFTTLKSLLISDIPHLFEKILLMKNLKTLKFFATRSSYLDFYNDILKWAQKKEFALKNLEYSEVEITQYGKNLILYKQFEQHLPHLKKLLIYTHSDYSAYVSGKTDTIRKQISQFLDDLYKLDFLKKIDTLAFQQEFNFINLENIEKFLNLPQLKEIIVPNYPYIKKIFEGVKHPNVKITYVPHESIRTELQNRVLDK